MSNVVRAVPSLETEINLQYLQAELSRIDVLIRREVRRWQLAGQDPADAFRGLSISAQAAGELASQPFGASWGQGVNLSPEEESGFQLEYKHAENQALAIYQKAQAQGLELRLRRMADIFNLDVFEEDAFLICLAPALDLRYERLYGFLQDNVTLKQASVNLILNLLCSEQRLTRLDRFRQEAPLFHYHLMEWANEKGSSSSMLAQSLHVDPTLVAWLLGNFQVPAEIGPFERLTRPVEDETDALLAAPLAQQIDFSTLLRQSTQPVHLLAFFGPDMAGRQAAARRCAAHLGSPVLHVDLAAAAAAGNNPAELINLALRDARLTGAIPLFSGWDVCLLNDRSSAESEQSRTKPGGTPNSHILAELCAFPGLVIVSSQTAWHAAGILRDKPFQWVEFNLPAYLSRRSLWNHFLGRPVSSEEDDLAISTLAGQFLLTGSQIRDAVATARDLAGQRGHAMDVPDLFAAARVHSNSTLGGLARKIEPRYTWNDMILPEDQLSQLREVVSTVRCRPLVLEEWGVGQKLVPSSGIPILFSGPPGTGKTMAAEVLAHELGLDLYKIELSGVVSKYIGETEKNLERIFDEAEQSNAILFFDEADAIFGKRSEVKDAHDRYANIETSYLLQRMEMYGGVTILATNLRANLDQAFTRRLQFSIDFPFPDENDRQRIWQALFPASIPHDPELDFRALAHSYKLAGGNIRNIIVSAAYTAAADGGSVNLDHLLHGVRREMQKMGRLMDEKSKKL
jgi:hypothetical protein